MGYFKAIHCFINFYIVRFAYIYLKQQYFIMIIIFVIICNLCPFRGRCCARVFLYYLKLILHNWNLGIEDLVPLAHQVRKSEIYKGQPTCPKVHTVK